MRRRIWYVFRYFFTLEYKRDIFASDVSLVSRSMHCCCLEADARFLNACLCVLSDIFCLVAIRNVIMCFEKLTAPFLFYARDDDNNNNNNNNNNDNNNKTTDDRCKVESLGGVFFRRLFDRARALHEGVGVTAVRADVFETRGVFRETEEEQSGETGLRASFED